MNQFSPIPVADAQAIIADTIKPQPVVSLPLDEAAGGVLKQALLAERDQPPFERVTMDGIALKAQATLERRNFQIASSQHAGDAAHELMSEQQCIEVMTGAKLPLGCDCVIPLEVYDKTDNEILLNTDYRATPWGNIHRQGSDREVGDTLLEPGTVLGATEIAVAATAGLSRIQVAKPMAIAIVTTGNELVDVGEPIEDYQIRRSNDRGIERALNTRGNLGTSRHHLADDQALLTEALEQLLTDNDMLVISGGVSKGVKDYVPGVLESLGVKKHFHGVTQRPGKPLWFGTTANGKTVFGLPGNPVSALVCCVRYVIPAIDRALSKRISNQGHAVLTESVRFSPLLTWFLPVTVTSPDGQNLASPKVTNTSGDFVSLVGSDGFLELEKDKTEFPAGYNAPFFPW